MAFNCGDDGGGGGGSAGVANENDSMSTSTRVVVQFVRYTCLPACLCIKLWYRYVRIKNTNHTHLVRNAAKNEMKIIIIDGSITLAVVIACVHYAGMRGFSPSLLIIVLLLLLLPLLFPHTFSMQIAFELSELSPSLVLALFGILVRSYFTVSMW